MRIEINEHQFGWEYEISMDHSSDRNLYAACNFDSRRSATRACYKKLMELLPKEQMKIEFEYHPTGWYFQIYSDGKSIFYSKGYPTKSLAAGASYDRLRSLVGPYPNINIVSESPNVFICSAEKKNEFDRAIAYGTKQVKERRKEEHDFGYGSVKAHQHKNGGGWVADTACVDDTAYVGPDAKVHGFAHVTQFARICDHARVYDHADVNGHAVISGDAQVYGHSCVYDNARVRDSAKIFEDARVYNYALIENAAQIYGHAEVFNSARVLDNALIYNYAQVYGCALIFHNAEVFSHGKVYDDALVYDRAKVCGQILGDARAYRDVLVEKTIHGDQSVY